MKKTLLLLALLVAIVNSQTCTITGCITCSSTTVGDCDVCNTNFGFQVTKLSPKVCQCMDGFYPDNPFTKCEACEAKFANCDKCTSSACTKCKQDYSLANQCKKPCEDIFEGCSACADLVCSTCDSGRNYTFNQGRTACECDSGFIKRVSTDKFCVPCYYLFDGCKTCTDSICQTCQTGFSQSGGRCSCSPQYFSVQKQSYYVSSTCVKCSTLDSVCATCSDSSTCTSCFVNRYYIKTGKCTLCSSAHDNCDECKSPSGNCTKCDDSYAVDTPGCSRCDKSIMGCSSCQNFTSCDQCDRGNNFKELKVGSPSTVCECIDQAYRNSTGCHLCSISLPNCVECISATNCTECLAGFYQQSGKCESCGTGCTACSCGSDCDTCDLAGFFSEKSGKCVCKANYTLVGQKCVTCQSVIFGCKNCTDEKTCTACIQQNPKNFLLNSDTGKCYCNSTMYYDSLSGNCELCSDVLSNCDACSNSTYCDECATGYTEGYTFGPTESKCVQCSSVMIGCLVCETTTVCTECDSANNFIFSGSSCQCAPAYYLNSGVCTLCNASFSPQCTACTSSGCTACAVDYFLNATSKLCQLCTSFSPQCTACTPTGCSACEDDYVVSSTSCARLCNIQLCIDCFNSTACQFCVLHATLNDDRTECNCNTGYFSDTTTCALCSTVLPNCAECESALKCTACQDGFVVDLETDQCAAFESALKMASLLLILVFTALSF